MKQLQVNIIGKSNGVGLARDIELLGAALRQCGHRVAVTEIDAVAAKRRRSFLSQLRARGGYGLRKVRPRSHRPNVDLNIMLEHVWLQYLNSAQLNVVVPNPEWFDRHDCKVLQLVDQIWAKTEYTRRVFSELGCPTTYIGFDSEDRYEGTVRRERSYFHLAGKSTMKGTDRLLGLWSRRPDWPRLTVVLHRRHALQLPELSNVELLEGYLSDVELRELQNRCAFHICMSLTEGWGHYIVEALSTGAVTVTVDAAPMNELVRPERGVLVGYGATGTQRLATTYQFDEQQLECAIDRTFSMSDVECLRIGRNARDWFLDNKGSFNRRLEMALQALPAAGRQSSCNGPMLADVTHRLRR